MATQWLTLLLNLGYSRPTIDAYTRALDHHLAFLSQAGVTELTAGREAVARWVNWLRDPRSRKQSAGYRSADGLPLSGSTVRQRICAARLYYDFLCEEGLREKNPLPRGRGFRENHGRSRLGPRFITTIPWIPTEHQWASIIDIAAAGSIRNAVMMALAYDGALRRAELCGLEICDIDPAHRTIHVRPEHAKNGKARTVSFTEETATILRSYLHERKALNRAAGPLFLSASNRNSGSPITVWTWNKVIAQLKRASGVDHLTTHTFRHLRLTDLARAGWDIKEIAEYAGHSGFETTRIYIHLSGREVAAKASKISRAIRMRAITMTPSES